MSKSKPHLNDEDNPLVESQEISDLTEVNVETKEERMKKLTEAAKEMPMLDRIILGPIKKYEKYNYFPWKLLIHI